MPIDSELRREVDFEMVMTGTTLTELLGPENPLP